MQSRTEAGMTDGEQCLYAERQRYVDEIAALAGTPDCVAEIRRHVEKIEYINAVLTELAQRKADCHWSPDSQACSTSEL